MSKHTSDDVQGRLLGMPYDWRRPTLDRIRRRYFNRGGPMFTPKVFGLGWSVNLAHPGTWALLGAVVTLAWLVG